MERRSKTVVRKGIIYHFTVEGMEYKAFIWQAGSQFCGRVNDNPQIAECAGRTAQAVRDALATSLTKAIAK